ncbi:MAG: T9SS type A sorting domain-containing protein [Bacteroidota bacterium]
MKQAITILFLLLTLSGQAQISITGDDMPSVDDTLRLSESFFDSLTRANYLVAGENVTWDFEHLRPLRQTVKNYERAIRTPYGFFFLGFNRYGVKQFDSLGVGEFQFREIYQYFKSDNREFRVEGIGLNFQGVPLPAYYRDEDEIYQFPLDYGDRDSSTFSFSLSIPALGGYESAGYRINTVDAWGTIKTPFGTFECIRVVSDIVSVDSIGTAGFKIGLPNVRKSYKWLANGVEVPILEIEGNLIAGNFVPTRIRYRDRYRRIEDIGEGFAPEADFSADVLMPRVSDTVRFTSTASNLTLHQWRITPDTYEFVEGSSANSPNIAVVFTEIGSYDISLQVNNAFGSDDTTKVAYIQVSPLSSTTQAHDNELQLQIFPNPAQEMLQVSYFNRSLQPTYIRIYDLQGRLLREIIQENTVFGHQEISIDIQALESGLYVLQMIGKEIGEGKFFLKE